MKVLGILLVMIGTGLAAAYGSQNPDPVMKKQIVLGRAAVLGEQTAAAKNAYCEAPALDATLVAAQRTDGCVFAVDIVPRLLGATGVKLDDARLSALSEAISTVEKPAAADKVDALRIPWRDLETRLAPALANAGAIAKVNEPASDRLSGWFDKAGVWFLLGLALIIAGGVIARRAIKAQAAAMTGPVTPGDKKPKFIDFGTVLDETRLRLDALAQAMTDNPAPTVGELEAQQDAIVKLQDDAITPMIESRPQLIARYGMGGFAEVFGPFSGGERYINRAWVALVDNHWEESKRSLETASLRFATTREALDKVVANSKSAA